MTLSLDGFGTALPEHCFTQGELAELHGTFCRMDDQQSRTLRALYRRSGVSTRRSVVLERADGPLEARQSFYQPSRCDEDQGPATSERMRLFEERAPNLASTAARRALDAAGVRPESVTHLVTVSCTGFVAPGVDAAIIDVLGLSRTTQRTNVGFMGCHGALNGLGVARSLVSENTAHIPLLCAVELCTLHFAYGWDPDMLIANALFSDGAAAVVGRQADGGPDSWRVAATGTLLMPESEHDMSWRIGDHGFRMTLSARVPDLIRATLKGWMRDWLADRDLTIDAVESWAVHPGGPRILGSVEEALGLSRGHTAVSREVLSQCGNMSSATILFILERLKMQGAPLPCVAMAFGPGLVVEAILIL